MPGQEMSIRGLEPKRGEEDQPNQGRVEGAQNQILLHKTADPIDMSSTHSCFKNKKIFL